MSDSKKVLEAKAEKLRKQVAAAEATLGGLREKLAKAEALLTGTNAPPTGLDILWKAALPISRNRSSRFKCRAAWNLIPKCDRPSIEDAVASLKIWNRCLEWKKDGNQYALALDRWIKERRWEDTPEVPTASVRYVTTPTPRPVADPSEAVRDRAEVAALLSLKPDRVRS